MSASHDESQKRTLHTRGEVLLSPTGFEMLQRFAVIVSSTDDAIISTTNEGLVTTWNPAAERMFGYSAQEIVGHPASRLVSVRGGDDMTKAQQRVRTGERVDHYEAIRRCKDGREIPVSVTVSGLRNPSGEIVGAVEISRDCSVTRHEETAIRTREKLAAVSRLATSIAHDINNPLASVTNLLFLLKEENLSDEGKHYLAIAQRELLRVTHISAHALGFCRGKGEPAWISPAEIFEDALALYQGRCGSLGVEVSRDYDTAATIFGHPGEFQQVIVNLIGNALDAMPSGGRLRLKARMTTDWLACRPGLRITVADTGAGIDAEARRRLFEPFYATGKPTGSGLGLWVCADILKRYDARISVRSSADRQHSGSVFCLFIPRE